MAFCRCCFISTICPGVSYTERPVMVCAECARHYGNRGKTEASHEKMMEKLRDSHAMAMERLDERREALIDKLARAKEEVQELTATVVSDYSTKLIGDVQNIVEHAIVDDAKAREMSARRARDRVMGAVFRIDEIHHESGDKCTWGKRITECAEFAALGFIRDEFYKWENRQLGLLKDGKYHGLPYDHPKARGLNRSAWKGLPSTRPSE